MIEPAPPDCFGRDVSRLDPAEPCESGDLSPHSKAAARRVEVSPGAQHPQVFLEMRGDDLVVQIRV